jgi:hypothetical protein
MTKSLVVKLFWGSLLGLVAGSAVYVIAGPDGLSQRGAERTGEAWWRPATVGWGARPGDGVGREIGANIAEHAC